MPAKRIILLDRPDNTFWFRYALWADVPAANQIAYRNPAAVSAYTNAAPAEQQAIRDGVVAELVGQYQSDAVDVPTVQTALQALWTAWQNKVTAVPSWNDYGRFWDNTATWNASPGVPTFNMRETSEGLPAFIALTPVSIFAANKFQFVLCNFVNPLASQVVKVRMVVIIPSQTVVTGVAPSSWNLQVRRTFTTAPSGAGLFAPAKTDGNIALPAGIGCYNAPAVSPAGGTVEVFNSFVPQADEVKLSTLDAPTFASILSPFGGQIVYSCNQLLPARPITIRAGECLEVVQSATAGTGNCQVLCVFTVG